jgi:acylphosphatase
MNRINAVRAVIRGRVQGVFYRASTQKEALRLKVCGWVRNCPDGSVEAVLEADEPRIEQMLEWCRKGPAAAKVSQVSAEPCPVEHFDSFTIRY